MVTALGIGILWMSGAEFPAAVPPGETVATTAGARSEIVFLTVGALLTALVRRRWITLVGALLGLLFTAGFLLNPLGLDNLTGAAGVGVAAGQGLQLVGEVTALIAGVTATLASDQKPARARQ